MLTGIVLLVSCSACTSSDDTIEEVPTVFSELRKQGFPIDSLEMADMADSLTRRVKPLVLIILRVAPSCGWCPAA